jgi:hypothetical protein
MFCPKCGTENPETGKFCRSCGTDLGNVSEALSGNLVKPKGSGLCDRRGRPLTWESAIGSFFMGLAFLAVAVFLGVTGTGRGWWFWLLIPAFMMLGSGVAKYVQLKKAEKTQRPGFSDISQATLNTPRQNQGLPPQPARFAPPVPESRYKTGDLVPPSVTDTTTRHLETNPEGETMTLPKV